MDEHTIFTKEALQSQDGKKVPLKDSPGGRTIGEATMRYDEESGHLMADFRVDDPKYAEFLKGPMPSISTIAPPLPKHFKIEGDIREEKDNG